MVVTKVVTLLFIAGTCSGVIYQLNDSEYDRMPPLFEIGPKYRSCLSEAGGVYCVAKFELHGGQHNELFRTIREYSQYDIKHYNYTVIDRAVCVSQTCKKYIHNETLNEVADLNVTLEKCVNETVWMEYGLEAKLAFIMSCDRHDERVRLDFADWAVVGILIFILAMNVIGSVYDSLYVKKLNEKQITAGNPCLFSFSIFRSWKKLMNTDTDPRFERLNGLFGLKSIPTFFVALAHVMWIFGSGFTDNPIDFEKFHDSLYYQIIFSGMVIVQIYFVISGCLLTFHLKVLEETQTLTWKDLPKVLFYRWARLTPANAMVVLFTGTWLPRLGSGPLWNVFVGSVATDCRTHWLKHLLYFNNYAPEDKLCAIQTWHLAAEMQLFIIGLVVYLATASRGRYPALALLVVLGMIGPAMHVWIQDLDALVIHRPEFYRESFEGGTFRHMHVLGHNNLSCHALGMAVGLLAYYCVNNSIQYNSKILKYITWCIPLGIIGLFLSGGLFYVDGERAPLALRVAYAAVHRPAIGVMTAVLVLNLVLRFEDFFRGILEWRGWMVTSRLCYGVFLLHVNIIHVMMGSQTQLGHVSFFNLVINHFGVISLSLAASVPFYLMLEAPMMSILKVLLQVSTNAAGEKQKKMN